MHLLFFHRLFVCENARDMEQPILLPLNDFTEEILNEKDDV